MTFVITDPCIGTMDQACVSVCPVDCIHFEEGADKMLYINPVECIDCGACQPACPVSAIFPEDDVPAAVAQFTEINSLWFSDPAAARAKVGGGDGAPAATPAETAEAPAASEAAAVTEAESAAATAPPSAATQTPVAERAAAAVAASPAVEQVPAGPAGVVPAIRQTPSPAGIAMLALLAVSVVLMFTLPGPGALVIAGQAVGLTVVGLLPLALLAALLFVVFQARDLGRYAAGRERRFGAWRRRAVNLRRNEESRRYYLEEIVQAIARDRFAFPNEENPDLQTFVNLPEPTMAIEPRGTGEKLFPDIVTVAQPGNYPVAIAQVESRETLTREQAANVWTRLENKDAPLYLYVPAGLLARAKDYARWAGLKNVKFRTWRWSPNGMVVREI